jgi:CIC family chloride channel protein
MESERTSADTIAEQSANQTRSRLRLLPGALVVGLLTGLVAAAFRAALDAGEAWRTGLFETGLFGTQRTPLGIGITALVVGSLIGLALWLVRRFAPETAGSGIPHLKLVLAGRGALDWRRILTVKFASGLAAIAGGLCLGREGPTIQMGAALGSLWSRITGASDGDRRSLDVAGASAGLAAAFNAPLSGIVFALEELRVGLPTAAMFGALVAAVAADIAIRAILGNSPVLAGPAPNMPPLAALPLFVALGAAVGLAGCLFNVALVELTRRLDFQSNVAHALKVLAATAAIVAAGYWNPSFIGGGESLLSLVLTGKPAATFLCLALAIRFVLSVGSYAVRTAGGIFAPLLVIGGLFGSLLGQSAADWFPGLAPEASAFAVAGMAAMFAAVVRCPLTGIVLMIEMTGHYTLILPLLVASFSANLVADALRVEPVYDSLLKLPRSHQ